MSHGVCVCACVFVTRYEWDKKRMRTHIFSFFLQYLCVLIALNYDTDTHLV